jgi:hypothetical protein
MSALNDDVAVRNCCVSRELNAVQRVSKPKVVPCNGTVLLSRLDGNAIMVILPP